MPRSRKSIHIVVLGLWLSNLFLLASSHLSPESTFSFLLMTCRDSNVFTLDAHFIFPLHTIRHKKRQILLNLLSHLTPLDLFMHSWYQLTSLDTFGWVTLFWSIFHITDTIDAIFNSFIELGSFQSLR